jgi:hypothetical protein
MRAVRALTSTGLEQPAGLEMHQHPVQQQVLGFCLEQPVAELRQHAEVKSRICQLQPQRVLPVDARAHCIGRLAIAQVLQELEDGHQGQPPGRQTWLSSTGVERGEVFIAVQLGEPVAQARDRRTARKRRSGHTFGLGGDGFYLAGLQTHRWASITSRRSAKLV